MCFASYSMLSYRCWNGTFGCKASRSTQTAQRQWLCLSRWGCKEGGEIGMEEDWEFFMKCKGYQWNGLRVWEALDCFIETPHWICRDFVGVAVAATLVVSMVFGSTSWEMVWSQARLCWDHAGGWARKRGARARRIKKWGSIVSLLKRIVREGYDFNKNWSNSWFITPFSRLLWIFFASLSIHPDFFGQGLLGNFRPFFE